MARERKEPPPELPAFSRGSEMVRIASPGSLEDLSPEWAFQGATGKGVPVAVVDSGIDADHPDLGGTVDEAAGASVEVDAAGQPTIVRGAHPDAFGHGTACAGIVHSLAPEATLVSVRVLGGGLSGKASGFAAGLTWAVEQGFDIINLSLGTSRRDWALAFHDICDQAYFGGTLLVTAANNVTRPSFPSLYASVASVACNLTADPKRFHYNPEPPTEFLAMGVDVDLAWKDGARMRGTGNSYAAPHIAGLAALIKSKHPELRPFQLKTALWATAANIHLDQDMVAGRVSRATRTVAGTRASRVVTRVQA